MQNIGDQNQKTGTSIAIWKSTKEKLDKNKAPGQCYNGFICELIDMWEQTGTGSSQNRAGSDNKFINKVKV